MLSLLGWYSESNAQEVNEGRLACVLLTNNQNAGYEISVKLLCNNAATVSAAYLNGVGSFLRLTRRGLLIPIVPGALMALLA